MLDSILDWYSAIGVDEAIGDLPLDRRASAQKRTATASASPPPPAPQPVPRAPAIVTQSQAGLIAEARRRADGASTLAELEQAVAGFEGCGLRATATKTVFADGNPAAAVMLIGEAPGGDEDRVGRPFVGTSGKLLDRMLAAIGLDRNSVYITNMLFWRPPGNRKPTESEIALCRPFVLRHIALVAPRLLVLVGGTAAGALLPGTEGITRIRGKWHALPVAGMAEPLQTMAMYHPSFLLRSPERKRDAWVDLLSIKSKLEDRMK